MKRRQTSLSEAWLIAGPTSSKKPVVTAEDDDDRPEMLDLSQASAATGGGATVDVGDSEPNVSVRCYCAQQHVVRMTVSVSSL